MLWKENMKLLNLEVENVFSYGHCKVDFSVFDAGVILVEGVNEDNPADSNGSGKSSLFEIINWILFDETIKDVSKDRVVRSKCKSCFGYLKFESVGDIIEITKKKKRGASYEFILKVNGELKKKKNQTHYLKYVNTLLDLNFDIWRNSIILGQGDKSGFLFGTDKSRKDLVGGILGFSLFDKILEKVRKEKIQVFEKELYLVEERIQFIKDKCGNLKTKKVYNKELFDVDYRIEATRRGLDTIKVNIYNMEENKKKVYKKLELEKFYAEDKKSWTELKASLKIYMTNKRHILVGLEQEIKYCLPGLVTKELLDSNMRGLESGIALDVSNYVSAGKEIARLETLIKTEQKESNGFSAKLESFSEGESLDCPYCGQKVAESCIKHFEIAIAKSDVNIKCWLDNINKQEVIEKISKENRVVKEAKILVIDDNLEKIIFVDGKERDKKATEELMEQKRTDTKAQKLIYEKQMERCEKDLKDIGDVDFNSVEYDVLVKDELVRENIITDSNDERMEIVSNIKLLTEFEKDMITLSNQVADIRTNINRSKILEKMFGQQGIRVRLLGSVIPFIEVRVNEYLSEIDMSYFRIELDVAGDKFNIRVLDDGEERAIETFSGGEKKLLTVLFNLALGEIVSDRKIGFDFLILDEVTDTLDELHSQRVIDMLIGIAKNKKKKLFLITHQGGTRDLLESFGVQKIVVEKKNGVSKIR